MRVVLLVLILVMAPTAGFFLWGKAFSTPPEKD